MKSLSVLLSIVCTFALAAAPLEIASVAPEPGVEVASPVPGVYKMTARTGKNPPKSAQYRRFILHLKQPLDLRGKELRFNASSKTGDAVLALFVRAFGSDRAKPDLSYLNYAYPFRKNPGPHSIRLAQAWARGILSWEPGIITGRDASAVTRIQFFVGSRTEDAPLELELSGFEVRPFAPNRLADTEEAVPAMFDPANLTLTGGTLEKISVGGRPALRLTATRGGRMDLKFELPFAIDMTQKQFSFRLASPDEVNLSGITVAMGRAGGKPDWLHKAWGTPLAITPGGSFRVYAASAGETLKFECRETSGKPADRVSSINFTFSCSIPDSGKFVLDLSDFAFGPVRPTGLAATDHWSPVPVYAKKPARVKHPVGPIREREIARARENVRRHQWAREQLEAIRRQAAYWLDPAHADLEFWLPAGEAFAKCQCPNCHTQPEYAWNGNPVSEDGRTIRCNKCKMVFPNEKFPENTTYTVQNPDGSTKTLRCYLGPDQIGAGENIGPRHHISGALRQAKIRRIYAVRPLALLYAIEGKKEYAETVRRVLLRFAELYPTYSVKFRATAFKSPREGHYMAGKLCAWKFLDSAMLPGLMVAYTLTYPSGVYSDADKLKIENGIAREYLWMITAYPPDADYCSNAVPAHFNCAAMCAAVLGDHDAMQWVVAGLPTFLKKYYRRDGFWHEVTASYANMANGPLTQLAATLHGYSDAADYRGKDRYENLNVPAMLPELDRVLSCMAPGILPTLYLPAVNDSSWNATQSLEQLELVADMRGDDAARELANHVAHRYPVAWARESLFRRDPEQDKPARCPEMLSRGWIVPGGGWAILRRPETAEKSATVLTYPGFSASHIHQCTLGFLSCEDGKEVIQDLGYQGAFHPAHRWIASILAHNLVIVDRQLQRSGRYAEIELFSGDTQVLAVRAAGYRTAGKDVTRYARTLADVPLPGGRKYLVDFFEVVGGKQHAYTFHAAGPKFAADLAAGANPDKPETLGGPELGTKFVKNVRAAAMPAGTHRFAWELDPKTTTVMHFAAAKPGRTVFFEAPGGRAGSLEEVKLHLVSAEQPGPDNVFATVIESGAPDKLQVRKVARQDAADRTALSVEHAAGRDLVTLYKNGDFTVERRAADGKLVYTMISGDRELGGLRGIPELRGKITAVSPDGHTLSTDLERLPDGVDWRNKIVSFDGLYDGAYRLAGAARENGKVVLKLAPDELPRAIEAGLRFLMRPAVEKTFRP